MEYRFTHIQNLNIKNKIEVNVFLMMLKMLSKWSHDSYYLSYWSKKFHQASNQELKLYGTRCTFWIKRIQNVIRLRNLRVINKKYLSYQGK